MSKSKAAKEVLTFGDKKLLTYWAGSLFTFYYTSYHSAPHPDNKYDILEKWVTAACWPISLPVLLGRRVGQAKLEKLTKD